MLADELQKAKQREQIAKWDDGERRLSEGFADIPRQQLSADFAARFHIFSEWAVAKQVRKCPAKPATVAAFILEHNALGVPPQQTIAILKAIEEQHDYHNLSNPTTTQVVRAAINQIIKVEPPRSWNKEEKAEWALLPPAVREAITRRESEREVALRRAQNKLADERKRLEAVATEEST